MSRGLEEPEFLILPEKELIDVVLLFTPISFSGLHLKNRVVMPPMATAIEGPVSYTHLDVYKRQDLALNI